MIDDVYEFDIEQEINSFVGSVFEDISMNILKRIISRDKYPYRIRHIGRWWNKQEEIDIVGFDNNKYVFGECKWRNQKCDIKVYEQLKIKAEKNFKYNDAHFYLFSKSGFTKSLIDLSRLDEYLHLYNLDNLIEGLEKQ